MIQTQMHSAHVLSDEEEQLNKRADVKTNWLSGTLNVAGIGIKYEYMLNSYISFGAEAFYNYLSYYLNELKFGVTFHNIGINLTTHIYPFGKYFYIGTGFGVYFYEYKNETLTEYIHDMGLGYYYSYLRPTQVVCRDYAFAISPKIGCRIDPGKPGRFFMDIGSSVPIIFGDIDSKWYDLRINDFEINYIKPIIKVIPYIGFGYAF